RNEAEAAEIFEYINPDVDEPTRLQKPVKPSPADFWTAEKHYKEVERPRAAIGDYNVVSGSRRESVTPQDQSQSSMTTGTVLVREAIAKSAVVTISMLVGDELTKWSASWSYY